MTTPTTVHLQCQLASGLAARMVGLALVSASVRTAEPAILPAGHPAPRVRGTLPAGLSDREVEVLRLVARGLSNRQIGEYFTISPRTSEHHVQHIYTKLGVSSRAAAAVFAMEHDLLD